MSTELNKQRADLIREITSLLLEVDVRTIEGCSFQDLKEIKKAVEDFKNVVNKYKLKG